MQHLSSYRTADGRLRCSHTVLSEVSNFVAVDRAFQQSKSLVKDSDSGKRVRLWSSIIQCIPLQLGHKIWRRVLETTLLLAYVLRDLTGSCNTLIRNASVLDSSGGTPQVLDFAVRDGLICEIGSSLGYNTKVAVDAEGLALAPRFIDVHTHNDIAVIRAPVMLPKLSQGVTTAIVGNCGMSAFPIQLRGNHPTR